jgi:hypothetical protein
VAPGGRSHRCKLEKVQRLVAPHIWPFFRTYQYSGNIKITRADARGAISATDEFFYNRIPKVANSTIISTLARYSTARSGTELKVDAKLFFQRPAFASSKTARDIKHKYYKFVFVRNPFTRVLSAYLDKVVRQNSIRYRRWALKNGQPQSPSFADFCRYLDGGGLYEDAHWAPQVDCLLIPFADFNFVGRFETVDADLKQVVTHIFGDENPVLHLSGPPRTHAGDKLGKYYSEEESGTIARLYAKDFAMFGYDPEALGQG